MKKHSIFNWIRLIREDFNGYFTLYGVPDSGFKLLHRSNAPTIILSVSFVLGKLERGELKGIKFDVSFSELPEAKFVEKFL